MSRTRVPSSIMASTAVAVLALLAASAVMAAPAAPDTGAAATVDQADKAPTQALLYEADSSNPTSHSGARTKKQTTTICVQVTPGRPGHAPAVLCGDRDEVDEQKRRMELQRVLQAPVVQVQPQAGYFGSPHVVQIVPASDTNSVTIESAGQGRTEPLVVSPSAGPSFTVLTGNSPLYRAAEAGEAQPQGTQAPQASASMPRASEQPADTKPAAPQGQSLSNVFAASAPPLPVDHANKPQARSFNDEEIIVSSHPSGYGGFGGHGQQVTVVREQPGYGASEVDVINGGRPGGFGGGFGGPGASFHDHGGHHEHGGFGGGYSQGGSHYGQGGLYDQQGYSDQPPMIGMSNFRAAEVAAAVPAVQPLAQQQAAPAAPTAPAPANGQARTAMFVQQPVVVRKDVVIPAMGTSTLSITSPAAAVRMPGVAIPAVAMPTVSVLPGLAHLGPQQVEIRQQSAGQASIPITLNCDLSTLQYRGSPQQLQLNLAQPTAVIATGRAAEAAAAADEQLKQTLGAAMDAAVRNSTVTVHLNGSAAQPDLPLPGDLAKLQEELATLQRREKMLYDTIATLKATGQQDNGAAIVGLQAAAEQITKARAAVEEAIVQPNGAAALTPKAADGASFSGMQSMTAAGLQDRMRSASQFRYVAEPGLASAMGPSSAVMADMSPYGQASGMYPSHQQTTIVRSYQPAGYAGYPDFRAAQPQAAPSQTPQPQPPAVQAQPKAAQQWQQDPLIQPAVPGSSATQQKLLAQLREAQEGILKMRSATLPRDQARQADGPADEFPPTPGYQYVARAAETAAPTPSSTAFTVTAGPVTLSANAGAVHTLAPTGPTFVAAPPSPTKPAARQAYWGR